MEKALQECSEKMKRLLGRKHQLELADLSTRHRLELELNSVQEERMKLLADSGRPKPKVEPLLQVEKARKPSGPGTSSSPHVRTDQVRKPSVTLGAAVDKGHGVGNKLPVQPPAKGLEKKNKVRKPISSLTVTPPPPTHKDRKRTSIPTEKKEEASKKKRLEKKPDEKKPEEAGAPIQELKQELFGESDSSSSSSSDSDSVSA
jgi:hypothetical protein